MSDGGVTLRLGSWGAGIVSALLVAIFAGVGTTFFSFRDYMIEERAWRENHEKSEALPRSEWTLERQFLYSKIEEQNARITLLENRRSVQ